ncbi:ABC transporter substrate-binding protein, partial [Thermodesulfobacteriota bacterium]
RIFLLVIGINVLFYVFLILKTTIFKTEVIYIAFIGPTRLEFTQNIVGAIEMYLENINAEGGIDGKKIELLIYDDRDDEILAEKIAIQIAEENSVLIVLGHNSSNAAVAAGKIYGLNEIPAITASATAEKVTFGNDWYFRTIPNNVVQADFISNYLHLTLKKSTASIVFDEGAYGSSLAANFQKTAKKLGISINGIWSFKRGGGGWINN